MVYVYVLECTMVLGYYSTYHALAIPWYHGTMVPMVPWYEYLGTYKCTIMVRTMVPWYSSTVMEIRAADIAVELEPQL